MTWDICFSPCCSTNTYSCSRSSLCAVPITVVWCGVVGLSRRRFGALLDCVSYLASCCDCLGSSQKSAIYLQTTTVVLSAVCWLLRRTSCFAHPSFLSCSCRYAVVHLNTLPLYHEHRVMCSEECLNSTVVVLHAEQSALISSPHFRRVLNFSRSDVSKNHAVNT